MDVRVTPVVNQAGCQSIAGRATIVWTQQNNERIVQILTGLLLVAAAERR